LLVLIFLAAGCAAIRQSPFTAFGALIALTSVGTSCVALGVGFGDLMLWSAAWLAQAEPVKVVLRG
jgi:hypothetical protein